MHAVDPKQCTRCKVFKPRSEFSRVKRLPRAVVSRCKVCSAELSGIFYDENRVKARVAQKKYKLKKAFGLTLEQYDSLLEAQGGGCAICCTKTNKGRGRFHVDHCHKTQKIRGILCQNCNVGIGNLKDDPKILLRAAEYLLKE